MVTGLSTLLKIWGPEDYVVAEIILFLMMDLKRSKVYPVTSVTI